MLLECWTLNHCQERVKVIMSMPINFIVAVVKLTKGKLVIFW